MHFSPREKKLPQSVNSNYTSTQATAGYLYTRTSTHNNQVDVATHTHTHEFCPHFPSHCSGHRPCEAEAMSRGWQRWRWSAHHVFSSFCICNISQVRCKIQWWLWKVQSSFGEGCHRFILQWITCLLFHWDGAYTISHSQMERVIHCASNGSQEVIFVQQVEY